LITGTAGWTPTTTAATTAPTSLIAETTSALTTGTSKLSSDRLIVCKILSNNCQATVAAIVTRMLQQR